MANPNVLNPHPPEFERFLYASVGEDRRGSVVTVLSTLARLSLDPWTEAYELACLDQEEAQARLMVHFEATTDIPALALASESRATKLVSLLPQRAPHLVSKSVEAGSYMSKQVSIFWMLMAILGALVLAKAFILAQIG